MAPIFDNGRALFPNVADDDAGQFLLEAELTGPVFGGRSFKELLSRIMGSRQQALVTKAEDRGIIGNTLAPAGRVAALDTFLRSHAKDLADIAPVDREELKQALQAAFERRPKTAEAARRLSPGEKGSGGHQ